MRQIVVLATGGTIAGRSEPGGAPLAYRAGQVGIGDLLKGLPVQEPQSVAWEQVAQVDSKDMALAVWQKLLARCSHWLADPDCRGLVVTHGTDTLEETAWLLQRVLGPAKPVVIASAMRPADAPDADGPRNLVDAIALARTEGASGVLVVAGGEVLAGEDVRKVHPTRLDAFSAGDAGPLARFDGDRLRALRAWPAGDGSPGLLAALMQAGECPWVEIVTSHAAAGPRAVDALVAAGVQGLVVACTGNGTIHEALAAALLRAESARVRVVRSTRCALGRVVPLPTERWRASSGTPAQARVDLVLDLLAG